MRRNSLVTAASVVALGVLPSFMLPVTGEDARPDVTTAAEKEVSSTHKQAQIIKPLVNDQAVPLNTFCLDRDGNILACLGAAPTQASATTDDAQKSKPAMAAGFLQVIAPDGKLIRSTELSFTPTAVNQAPNGQIYVAGQGTVAIVSAEGKVLTTATSPHIGDKEAIKSRVIEDMKKQRERSQKLMNDQIAKIDERIAAITSKPEAERTEIETKRLSTFAQQKTLYETQLQNLERAASVEPNVDLLIARKLGITALAVTGRDVFLCCTSIEGTGYEVWRTNHELSEPVRVVTELRGCCGQCDIQATDDHLILAENTRFQVALLDRDGKRASAFGKGDRKAVDGFGSCCNPMNVRCCSNGDILTAESSIGTIKRFSKSGELVGVVGKARIGGGCKHVAVAVDEKRDRYYMMNVDKDHICVLVPLAEAPEMTSEEALADAARKGLGTKLIGEWSLDGTRPENAPAPPTTETTEAVAPDQPAAVTTQSATAVPQTGIEPQQPTSKPAVTLVKRPAAARIALPARAASDPYSSTYLNFIEDGSLLTVGGMAGVDGWEPLRQDGNILYVSQIRGGIQYYEYKVEFVNDNEATISLMYNDRALSSNRYKRIMSSASGQ